MRFSIHLLTELAYIPKLRFMNLKVKTTIIMEVRQMGILVSNLKRDTMKY
jgi:hypothetical protein